MTGAAEDIRPFLEEYLGLERRKVRGIVFKRSLFVLAAIAFLALFLFLASLAGLLAPLIRWALFIIILFFGIALALGYIRGLSVPVVRLRRQPTPTVVRRGAMQSLLELVERANRGMTFSQLMTAQRVRDVLLERMRVVRGIGYEGINELRRHSADLETFLGDWELAQFVTAVDEAPDDIAEGGLPRGSPLNRAGPDFVAYMDHVLRVVEAWH